MSTKLKERSIKRYRQFAGFTQKTLAAALNMPLSTYQQKEQGRIGFNDHEMLDIKKIFSSRIGNVSIDDIFFK